METQKITIEQAIAMVNNNLSSVFTKDDVYDLLTKIELPTPEPVKTEGLVHWSEVFDELTRFTDRAADDVESGIRNYWDDLVDYNEYELDFDSYDKKLSLESVGFCDDRNHCYKIADNLIDQFKYNISNENDLDESGYPNVPEEEESTGEGTKTSDEVTDVESINTQA
jgi:hypothetical protein